MNNLVTEKLAANEQRGRFGNCPHPAPVFAMTVYSIAGGLFLSVNH